MELDRDRPHLRSSSSSAAAATSELFICFTSRLSSSSSMKLSKSILSPGRASLSTSLSRRLRTNGSLKGGASPFFATTGKKRGCAFENPEPSSPKVTCIGQVRVKTKKKVKRNRSVSKRRSGEVSFRKMEQAPQTQIEDKACAPTLRYSNASAHYQPPAQECLPHRNQRWVHLPISICEALRAEFSCLFPCKSCFSTSGKGEKDEDGCGAVFARWLVSVNDGEGGKRKKIELVVGGGDEEEEEEEQEERLSLRSSRRHVFEDIEVKDDRIELKGKSMDGEEEGARVSICIPPKNALLLMRCRSDPIRMAALANADRFSWAAPKTETEDIEEEDDDDVDSGQENAEACEVQVEQACEGEQDPVLGEANEEKEIPNEAQPIMEVEVGELSHGGDEELAISREEVVEEELAISSEEMVEEKAEELQQEILWDEEALKEEEGEKEEVESNMSSFEALLVQENTYKYEEDCTRQDDDKEEMEDFESPTCHLPPSTESDEDDAEPNSEFTPPLPLTKEAEAEAEAEKDAIILPNNDEENQLKQEELETPPPREEEEQREVEEEMVKRRPKVLPECLLLMMCEPKLSMEVSKETWVCSTDFIRWVPRKAAKADNEAPVKRRLSVDSKEPPRSSSMAAMIEQKLVNAVAYEPFVLTRCKSEPMRTAAAKLIPESCFWKNAMRKLEPHRRGVGATGIGF